jgi:antitoxin ParD1/3/4
MATGFPPELQQFVEQVVASGQFGSADEVVVAGLRLLREREAKLQALRDEILPALEQLKRGEKEPLDIEAIKAWGREQLAMLHRTPQ